MSKQNGEDARMAKLPEDAVQRLQKCFDQYDADKIFEQIRRIEGTSDNAAEEEEEDLAVNAKESQASENENVEKPAPSAKGSSKSKSQVQRKKSSVKLKTNNPTASHIKSISTT